MTRKRLPALVALVLLPLPAAAEDVAEVLQSCRAEGDDARRLACYDRAMDRAVETSKPAATNQPVTASTPVEEPAPAETKEHTPEERFGRTGAMAREEIERKSEESRELRELTATVTEIWTRSDGLMAFTLDNGQTWSMNRPDSLFRIKNGDKVKIQPAALGSFLLSGPSKRSTRVTRTK
ncbi:MAG: hypothetical protein M3O07_08200 [Pseudomonadota bacterium]|nr:hypothetical protein [Pseudomonadota bacterium]